MSNHATAGHTGSRTSGASCFLAALFHLATALPGEAQEPTADIVGRAVLAGNEQPVPDVDVLLEGADFAARTDERGLFIFEDVPLGRYVLAVTHLRYAAVRDSIILQQAGAVYRIQIHLSDHAIALDPIQVNVFTTGGPLDDVQERMERMGRLGLGDIFDRQAIEESGAARVSHLVARLPGVRLQPISGRAGAAELRLHTSNDCPPAVYMDGRQVALRGASIDDLVALSDVAFLEVYRRLSELPAEFADEQAQYCGAVAIWTRRGADSDEPFGFGRILAATAFAAFAYLLTRARF